MSDSRSRQPQLLILFFFFSGCRRTTIPVYKLTELRFFSRSLRRKDVSKLKVLAD